MDEQRRFDEECRERVASYAGSEMERRARAFMVASTQPKYSYNFRWLSRPIIQYPQDMVALQQLIWQVRPTLVVETGIAHGGSLVLSASLLAMLDYCDAAGAGAVLDPGASRRRVLGIDIDIRPHNRDAIRAHPLAHLIDMLQGSSTDPGIVAQVHAAARGHERILVILDSNHTHAHVLAELEAYAPLVSRGSYCVVFDTFIEDMPADAYPDRPWGRGDNPKTAVRAYLARLERDAATALDGAPLRFEVDTALAQSLLMTVAPEGFLRRT